MLVLILISVPSHAGFIVQIACLISYWHKMGLWVVCSDTVSVAPVKGVWGSTAYGCSLSCPLLFAIGNGLPHRRLLPVDLLRFYFELGQPKNCMLLLRSWPLLVIVGSCGIQLMDGRVAISILGRFASRLTLMLEQWIFIGMLRAI